jgi:hypothetical protein
MLKKIFQRFIGRDHRSTPRHSVSKYIQCLVTKDTLSLNEAQVYLSDISTDGLSFFFKNPWFEMNDRVHVYLHKDSQAVSLDGSIVSQRVFYPEGRPDLKYALYRYSIKFSTTLDSKSIDPFKNSDGPTV